MGTKDELHSIDAKIQQQERNLADQVSDSNLKLQNLDQEHEDLKDEILKYNMRLKNRVKNTAKLKRDLTENAEELERLTETVR